MKDLDNPTSEAAAVEYWSTRDNLWRLMVRHSRQEVIDPALVRRWRYCGGPATPQVDPESAWRKAMARVIALRDQRALDILVKNEYLTYMWTPDLFCAAVQAGMRIDHLLSYGGCVRHVTNPATFAAAVSAAIAGGRDCAPGLHTLLATAAEVSTLPVSSAVLGPAPTTFVNLVKEVVRLGIPGATAPIVEKIRAGDVDAMRLYAAVYMDEVPCAVEVVAARRVLKDQVSKDLKCQLLTAKEQAMYLVVLIDEGDLDGVKAYVASAGQCASRAAVVLAAYHERVDILQYLLSLPQFATACQ